MRHEIRSMLGVTLIVAVFTAIMFGYLYRNIQISTLKYEINRLQKKEKELYLSVEELRLSVARYSRASRVEKLFKDQYGYVPVQVSQKITTLSLPELTDSLPEESEEEKGTRLQNPAVHR